MREIRPRKSCDNENIEKGIKLLFELFQKNPDIEPTLWAPAVFFVLISGYENCGFTYHEFRGELEQMCRHYREIFKG